MEHAPHRGWVCMAGIAPGTRQWLQLSAVDQITGAWNKRPEQTKKWLAYM